MRDMERVAIEIRSAAMGDPWYGVSVASALEGVDHDMASARVPGLAHSIWEQVLHMTAWADWVERRLPSGAAELPADGGWSEIGRADAASWQAAIDDLRATRERLAAAVEALPDGTADEMPKADLVDDFGQPVTWYRIISGVAQHDAYHCGQIVLLKKLLAR